MLDGGIPEGHGGAAHDSFAHKAIGSGQPEYVRWRHVGENLHRSFIALIATRKLDLPLGRYQQVGQRARRGSRIGSLPGTSLIAEGLAVTVERQVANSGLFVTMPDA